MSAKKPKAPKVPELPPPPAITDPRVQEAENNDRLARRKGAMAAVFAGRTNRMVRPTPTAAEAERNRARDQRRQANSPSGVQQSISQAQLAEALRQAQLAAAGAGSNIRSFVPSRTWP